MFSQLLTWGTKLVLLEHDPPFPPGAVFPALATRLMLPVTIIRLFRIPLPWAGVRFID